MFYQGRSYAAHHHSNIYISIFQLQFIIEHKTYSNIYQIKFIILKWQFWYSSCKIKPRIDLLTLNIWLETNTDFEVILFKTSICWIRLSYSEVLKFFGKKKNWTNFFWTKFFITRNLYSKTSERTQKQILIAKKIIL